MKEIKFDLLIWIVQDATAGDQNFTKEMREAYILYINISHMFGILYLSVPDSNSSFIHVGFLFVSLEF